MDTCKSAQAQRKPGRTCTTLICGGEELTTTSMSPSWWVNCGCQWTVALAIYYQD